MRDLFCARCIPRWVWALCVLCLLASIWIGSVIGHRPAQIQLTFHAYDTDGKPLAGAAVEVTADTPFMVPGELRGNDIQKEMAVGDHYSLQFRYRGKPQSEEVVWRTTEEFKMWLDTDFRQLLQRLDPDYDRAQWDGIIERLKSESTPIKYEYPVVFRVKP